MQIKICCEWCGKIMKTVNSFEAVRDAQQKGEDKCKTCQKKIGAIDRFLTREREEAKRRLDLVTKELRENFRQKMNKGDLDGEDLQNVGAKNKAP